MGHLFLISDSFELSVIPLQNRDKIFGNFCKIVNLVKINKDSFFANDDFYIKQFSFGNIYEFICKTWAEINSNPNTMGISTTTYNLYFDLMKDTTHLSKHINSIADFNQRFADQHFGYSGLENGSLYNPYISNEKTWYEWKCSWYCIHQNEIHWESAENNFLPNLSNSNAILWDEVLSHNMENNLKNYNGDKVTTFYEEVMKKKGSEMAAYAKQIGSKVAKLNYYSLDKPLSKNENRAAGGSFREIYSIVNADGEKQYISIDHKHGMFEYYDHKGKHLGEYRFDGTSNKPAQNSHNLRTI